MSRTCFYKLEVPADFTNPNPPTPEDLAAMAHLKAQGYNVALMPTCQPTDLIQWEGEDKLKLDSWEFLRDKDNPRVYNYQHGYLIRNADELMTELSKLCPGVFRLEARDEEGYRWVLYAKDGVVKTVEAEISFEGDPWGAYPDGVGPLIY